MKESMRKPVLFFMDLMVVFLAVILTIELIAIAGFTFPFMETGHRTSAFLRRIQDQEYQKCVEYYYENNKLRYGNVFYNGTICTCKYNYREEIQY